MDSSNDYSWESVNGVEVAFTDVSRIDVTGLMNEGIFKEISIELPLSRKTIIQFR